MATPEQVLEHPLTLLLIGAGFSLGLGTWLTHWLENRRKEREIEVENRRKELEIRVDIVSKMTEVKASQKAVALTSMTRKKKKFTDTEKDAVYENLQKWHVDVNIVSSKLESYFSDPGLKEKWVLYCAALLSFSNVSRQYFLGNIDEETKENLKGNLEIMEIYFLGNKQINWDRLTTDMTYDDDQWNKISHMLEQRGDEIIRDVLKLPIKVF